MIPRDVHLESCSIPLIAPLALKKLEIVKRDIGLLTITQSDAMRGYGEIAPLPFFHKETLSQAIEQCKTILPLLGIWPLIESDDGIVSLDTLSHEKQLYPSVQLGMEMALTTLAWNTKTLYLKQKGIRIPLNCLVATNDITVLDTVMLLLDEGYTSIKVKVNQRPIEEEITIVQSIKDLAQDRALIRLDANRGWTVDEAIRFGNAIGNDGIEYIEEPVLGQENLQTFYVQTKIPVALDETIYENAGKLPALFDGLAAFILKPAAIGSLARTVALVEYAKAHHIKPIISSMFESWCSLMFFARFIAYYNLETEAAGLDTWRWLYKEKIKEFDVECGYIVL
jgi:O-succinylbenzoate synthase